MFISVSSQNPTLKMTVKKQTKKQDKNHIKVQTLKVKK